jgi:hypothetical protein
MTNSNSNDRLDRIEAILENVALGQQRFALQQQEYERRQEEQQQRFALQQQEYERRQEEQQENFNRDLLELKNIVMSNSRSIQAMQEQRETDRLLHEERMLKIEQAIIQLTNVEQGLTNMLVGLDENQPTILRRLMSIENKVDRILDRNQD